MWLTGETDFVKAFDTDSTSFTHIIVLDVVVYT